VLLVAVLHFITGSENPWKIVDCIKDHMAPGSYLALSRVTGDDIPPDAGRSDDLGITGTTSRDR
jgi:S-adenosyl methyltransferase